MQNYSSYNVIIARYNENIDWINDMDKSKIIIYNKSDELIENAINRPNIGRDPETFLYHIIQNYENLPDYLFFLQGRPFDHFTHLNDTLQNEINKIINSEIKIDVAPFLTNLYTEKHDYFIPLNTKYYYSLIFKGDAPDIFAFSAGCQYVVSKKNILNRPKSFYEKIYNMIIATADITNFSIIEHTIIKGDINSMNVWTLERLLFYIFSTNIEISEDFIPAQI